MFLPCFYHVLLPFSTTLTSAISLSTVQTRRRIPGVGQYDTLHSDFKEPPEFPQSMSVKNKNKVQRSWGTEDKILYNVEDETRAAETPGIGYYNPKYPTQVMKVRVDNKTHRDWIKLHQQKLQLTQKAMQSQPSASTYNPIPVLYNTF